MICIKHAVHYRFDEEGNMIRFLRLASIHDETKCNVCNKEKLKANKIKMDAITKTLVKRQILPLNHCWMCDIDFQESCVQIQHFSHHHECEMCCQNFEYYKAKQDHFCFKKKFKPWKVMAFLSIGTISITFFIKNFFIHKYK